MAPPKKKAKKQQATAIVYDDLCYLASPNPVPDRCGASRVHFFISAWLGYQDRAEDYYDFAYRKSKKEIKQIGSADSFEDLLRKLGTEIQGAKYDQKLVGDLIILTHGIEYFDKASGVVQTVKIKLPLFSMGGPDGSLRSLPYWWDQAPKELDAEHLERLRKPGDDFYEFVDGKDHTKDGLLTVVAKKIASRMDASTHVWLVGCNLGKNKPLLKQVRKIFGDTPVVYAFTKRHLIRWIEDGDGAIVAGNEMLAAKGANSGPKLWSQEGMTEIVHEP